MSLARRLAWLLTVGAGCAGGTSSPSASDDTVVSVVRLERADADPMPPTAVGTEPVDYTRAPLFFEVDGVGAHPSELQGGFKQLSGRLDDLAAEGVLEPLEPATFVDDEWLDGGAQSYTLEELRAIVAAHRGLTPPPGAAGVYVLVVDGGYETDTSDDYALGFAFDHNNIAVFMANVRRRAAATKVLPQLQVALVAGALLLHELGHVMGLVNDGLPMQVPHQDEEHGHHDLDPECIMHWAADRPHIGVVLGAQPSAAPTTFCANCRADIVAARAAWRAASSR